MTAHRKRPVALLDEALAAGRRGDAATATTLALAAAEAAEAEGSRGDARLIREAARRMGVLS
jgi:hypothetical protein